MPNWERCCQLKNAKVFYQSIGITNNEFVKYNLCLHFIYVELKTHYYSNIEVVKNGK